jgi:hypothetical protein
MIKVLNIEIEEFRGIRKFSIDFAGENFAICGSPAAGGLEVPRSLPGCAAISPGRCSEPVRSSLPGSAVLGLEEVRQPNTYQTTPTIPHRRWTICRWYHFCEAGRK